MPSRTSRQGFFALSLFDNYLLLVLRRHPFLPLVIAATSLVFLAPDFDVELSSGPLLLRQQSNTNTAIGVDLPQKEIVARKNWILNGSFSLDVGVPVRGREKRLVEFFAPALGEAIRYFHTMVDHDVHFRLLVTRYSSDNSTIELQQSLASSASLGSLNDVVFVQVNSTDFHKAEAINSLHKRTHGGQSSIFAMVDVDMWVGPRFLFNALKEANQHAVYFPVVFSENRPSTVLLVEKLLGPQARYSRHRGLWRSKKNRFMFNFACSQLSSGIST